MSHKHSLHILAFETILIVMFTLAGCSGLRLPQSLKVDALDWPMFGKYETRLGFTSEAIVPPLSLVWSYDITGGIGTGSPLIVDSTLFVGNMRGELHAVNTNTGKRIGWITLGDAIIGSPAVEGNVAFVSLSNTDLSLVAFDLIEGKPHWRKPFGDLEASPLIHGDRIYIGNTDGIFYCVDRATGDELWKFKLLENTKHNGIRSSAAASGNTIVVGMEDGALYALDAGSGKELWRCATGAVIVATPCIANDAVYIGNLDGMFSAIDLESGVLRWQFNAGSSIYANPSYADGRIFIGTTGGILFALDAKSGGLVWKSDLGGVINSGATVSGNILYIGTLKKFLFGINAADGAIIVKQEIQGRVKTSPAIANGRLYIGTDDKLVLAFKGVSP